MAPSQEIAIRAVGTALAGLSLATAVHLLAYGGGKTRVNGAEYVAISAAPRARAVEASPIRPPGQRVIDLATTGALPAAGKSALRLRPAEIVAARADSGRPRIDRAISPAAPRQAALAAVRSAP